MTGHLEYDSDTLAKEYFRDLDKGMNPEYSWLIIFRMMTRRKSRLSAGVLPVNCSSNWLNYYVYQSTPYDVRH